MSNIFDKFSLKDSTAIVTGGAGLLGKEFSRTLAQAGALVVVADLNLALAQQVADDLNHEGDPSLREGRAFAVGVDVTQPDSVRAMVSAALDASGRVDVLVNSAAMDPKFDSSGQGQHGNTFEDYPVEAWRSALDVNLTGMFLCCQAVARPMVAQDHGSIINICSTYGLVGPDQRIYEKPSRPGFAAQPRQFKPAYYSVTKAGVLGMTRYLATYFAGKNVRANALTPGGVYNNHDDLFTTNYSARTVLGRMARRDEMNGALLFLASDASSYMTGSNVVVDGGWTAW